MSAEENTQDSKVSTNSNTDSPGMPGREFGASAWLDDSKPPEAKTTHELLIEIHQMTRAVLSTLQAESQQEPH